MAADLHIHVFEGIDEEDLRIFKRNTLGSKHFDPVNIGHTEGDYQATHPEPASWAEMRKHVGQDEPQSDWDVAYARVADTPHVEVGEVSWLKAAFFEDSGKFVPDPIQAVNDLVGEDLPVIDDEFLDKLAKALQLENKTQYSLSPWRRVMSFLESNRGKRVFTVSW